MNIWWWFPTRNEETPTRWKRPVRILLMVNQWSSSERNSAWCYPLADALLSRIALLMNSLCLVSACAGLDYEWTKKSSRSETRFMHYSVLIIFHALVRTAFICAFTRTWNCGGRLIVIQKNLILQFTCLFFFFGLIHINLTNLLMNSKSCKILIKSKMMLQMYFAIFIKFV